MSVIERLDRFQRGHPRAGMPIAVVYKFVDDQGSYLAALITYYGFLSIFPLLLLSSTILSFVLEGHPALQRELLDSALGQFPIVGSQLADPSGMTASGIGLVVGILGTLYGGLGVTQAAQNAMNTIWRVPRNNRPNPLASRGRGLLLLSVVGLAVVGSTALAALGSVVDGFGIGAKILLGLATLAVNAAVFTVAFRVATVRPVTWRESAPGAVIAAVIWQLLQYVGAIYVGHVVRHATAINGVFAIVLGLIAWIYLESFVVVLAAEYNSVRALGLFPRALLTPFTDDVELTPADEASYAQQAKAQRAKGFQQITVSFETTDE
ncbi:MAG TPA: YihY/virulence factor BrkB family protein [Jatrophihabitans sp.]|jgi:YihY family inner membrane protein|uniref:YihY/virulence factor BrkB family protein n=1 Tax=Jatrophihabitans sp. TaxID=1932789 RepID=UPI002E05F8E7|nr:YihY/virulence factor BrkB family protein [Jatrophihabitans sp.]